MNIALSRKILMALADAGVADVIICAGARNSPLVSQLEKTRGLKIWNFFEERSAGFFALGHAQRDGRPMAVITTSGTAVAELLPAAVEATYSGTPLIFVTADRPQSYRGTGAPQSIDQVGIFSGYVEKCLDIVDLEQKIEISRWSGRAPLQINICFDEPLIDEPIEVLELTPKIFLSAAGRTNTEQALETMDQPIVIAGTLGLAEAQQLVPILLNWGAPIFAESLSNLRNIPQLQKLFLRSSESTLRWALETKKARSVIRVGGVPTLRLWRDLEEKFCETPVHSFSSLNFSGLSRRSQHTSDISAAKNLQVKWDLEDEADLFAKDLAQSKKLQSLLEKYPQSEAGLLHQLGPHLVSQFLYLGNSLPIREWDLVCPFTGSPARMAGNRGANGIDGQISSFFGQSSDQQSNWALLGDLTTLYDLSAPWLTPQLGSMKLRIVVINNRGGMIFKNMFQSPIFLNQHQVEFSQWAKMWNWSYQNWTEIPSQSAMKNLPEKVVIELVPDTIQSDSFWRELRQL